MNKISSGIEGFDRLVFGGIPKGRAYLVAGEPGTGKTIFGLQFLLQGLTNDEKAVYVVIDQKPDHIIQDMAILGLDIRPHLEKGTLQILDISSYFKAEHLKQLENLENHKIIEDITSFVKKAQATRLVIDPIIPLIFSQQSRPDLLEYIHKLIFNLESNSDCTTLITSDVPVGSNKMSIYGIEEFLASGIIKLNLKQAQNKSIRTVTIKKMRGTQIDLSEYHFEIIKNRGIVLRQPI